MITGIHNAPNNQQPDPISWECGHFVLQTASGCPWAKTSSGLTEKKLYNGQVLRRWVVTNLLDMYHLSRFRKSRPIKSDLGQSWGNPQALIACGNQRLTSSKMHFWISLEKYIFFLLLKFWNKCVLYRIQTTCIFSIFMCLFALILPPFSL